MLLINNISRLQQHTMPKKIERVCKSVIFVNFVFSQKSIVYKQQSDFKQNPMSSSISRIVYSELIQIEYIFMSKKRCVMTITSQIIKNDGKYMNDNSQYICLYYL
ncbi:hypothetical protein ABPG72_018707 [Tetrahymena utriculariae]